MFYLCSPTIAFFEILTIISVGLSGKSKVIMSPFLLAINGPLLLLKQISDDVLPEKHEVVSRKLLIADLKYIWHNLLLLWIFNNVHIDKEAMNHEVQFWAL